MRITPRLFLSIAAAAGVSMAIAIGVYAAGDRWVSPGHSGKIAFPSLESRINEVASIEIVKGDQTLKLARDGEGWVAQEPYHYRVNSEEVRKFVIGLAQARLEEPKTRKSDKYELLGLGEPGEGSEDAKRVRLLDGSGAEITVAVLGKKKWDAFGSGKSGYYLRIPGDPQSWLASLDVKASPKISDWVRRELFTTDLKNIRSITIEHPGEDPLIVKHKAGTEDAFELSGIPEDAKRKESGPGAVSVAEAYTGIELEDLRKLDGKGPEAGQSTSRLETADGLTVTLYHRKDGTDHWISVKATGSGDAKEKAEELNSRVSEWEFKIPGWKADKLFRRRSDFLETS